MSKQIEDVVFAPLWEAASMVVYRGVVFDINGEVHCHVEFNSRSDTPRLLIDTNSVTTEFRGDVPVPTVINRYFTVNEASLHRTLRTRGKCQLEYHEVDCFMNDLQNHCIKKNNHD